MEDSNNAKIIGFINGLDNLKNNKKAIFYTRQFDKFNLYGITTFKFSWNCAAFFLGWVHLFYRKLYVYGIIFSGINILLAAKFMRVFRDTILNYTSPLDYMNHDLEIISAITVFYVLGVSVLCGLLNNFLIYLRYRKENKKAEKTIPNNPEQIEYLKTIGGKNKKLAALFGTVYYLINTYILLYYVLIILGFKIYLKLMDVVKIG